MYKRQELLGARYAAVTVSVLALVTIIAFETMAVSTAMPKVTQDLGAGAAYGLAFSLMFTGQLLGIALAGALAALRGPVLTLWSGATLFAIGSCVAGLAMDFAVLLLGRLVAGIGAGLALVAIYVVIGAAYQMCIRDRGLGATDPVPDAALGLRRARAATAIMLALPGSAYLYQGEELGLPEHTSLPDELRQDPTWVRTDHGAYGRDGCRVPMPWAGDAPAYGFNTTGASWLPQPAAYGALAVDRQQGVPGSTYELYRTCLLYTSRCV